MKSAVGRRFGVVAVLLFVLSVWLLPFSAVADSRDEGTSLNLLLKAKLKDDWFLLSRSNLASRNTNDDWFFGYAGASLGYQWNDVLSLRLGYRYSGIKLAGEWQYENRPFLEAYAAKVFEGFRLTNRSRIEWRFFDHRDDDVRLRNEVTVTAPWRLTALGLRPYLEEEFFYSTDKQRFEANWLGGGLSWKAAKGVKLKAGYRWNRFRVGNNWKDRDTLVLGVSLFY